MTTWSEGSPHCKYPSCQVWWSQALCKRKNFVSYLSRDLTDFIIRESYDIMSEFPSSLVTTLQMLVIIDLLEEEILSFQFVT